MIIKADEVRLNVQPVFLEMEHLYKYEGPCRVGQGEALEVGFDAIRNAEWLKAFRQKLADNVPAEVADVRDIIRIKRTDNWDQDEQWWEQLQATTADTDFYIIHSFLGLDDIAVEFGERIGKPFSLEPEYENPCSTTSVAAALNARDRGYEFYGFRTWGELVWRLRILRARKVLQNTRILMAPRNGAALSFSGVDGAFDTEELTHNTGCRFRYISIHELLDQASPALPGGNHTTPGRDTWDITDEDLAEIEAAADDLISRAEEVEVDRRYVVNSLKFFKTVRKHMDRLDCCGFTAPCPDSCSTRRLNEEQFTFCLAHSLNMRDGLPSACEYDACSVVTQQALIAVSGQRCFMGNTMPVVKEADGEWATFGLGGIEDEDMPLLDEHEGHLYMMVHSVPNPRMNDPLEDGPYSLRHFAEEQGFGAVYRYDFNRDKGKAITVARFSPEWPQAAGGARDDRVRQRLSPAQLQHGHRVLGGRPRGPVREADAGWQSSRLRLWGLPGRDGGIGQVAGHRGHHGLARLRSPCMAGPSAEGRAHARIARKETAWETTAKASRSASWPQTRSRRSFWKRSRRIPGNSKR